MIILIKQSFYVGQKITVKKYLNLLSYSQPFLISESDGYVFQKCSTNRAIT